MRLAGGAGAGRNAQADADAIAGHRRSNCDAYFAEHSNTCGYADAGRHADTRHERGCRMGITIKGEGSASDSDRTGSLADGVVHRTAGAVVIAGAVGVGP